MIASLMMYQRAELRDSHDRYWELIRNNLSNVGIESPEKLSQNAEEFSVWKNPTLVLSQTCGMPYRTWLHDQVELVGTPDFGLAECPSGYYRSVLITRADDLRLNVDDFQNATFAYNQTFSQSGYASAYWHLDPIGIWFENQYQTEHHLESARAVAEGRADIASLDIVSWMMMCRYESFVRGLRVLELTEPNPGLPLITAKGNDADSIFSAVELAIEQLTAKDRDLLGLKGIVRIPKEKYMEIPNPPFKLYRPDRE